MTDGRIPRIVVEAARRQAAAEVARRFQLTLVLAGLIGVVTGVGVAGFDVVVGHSLRWVQHQPVWLLAIVPSVALVVVAVIAMIDDGDTATTDAYVRTYHERGGRLPVGRLWAKLTAAAVSLGSGAALGFEGPSLLLGATIGSFVEDRSARRLRRDDAKVLMVAGAAAGVAAVFKAPLTGVVFALEVPYRSDVARRAMLPTLVAAGASYVTYVALVGTEPLLSSGGSAPFDLRDLGGGLVVGIVCGILARLGAWSIGHAKRLPLRRSVRVLAAAAIFAGLAPLTAWWFDSPLHLGPGYLAIDWAVAPQRTVAALVGLFVVRAFATWVSVGAGGVGGLFIPLVAQGAIVGAICQHLLNAPNARLFPVVGIAAFLGAGYRTPLAGVAFVAEATGQPGFLVPALLAAAVAQLAMGPRSFSPYQHREREPDIEPLTRLPVADIMSPRPDTVDGSLSLDATVELMLRQNRRWAPVLMDGAYFGLIAVTDIADVDRDEWATTTAADVARTDIPPAAPDDPVSLVAARLRSSDDEAVAVTDDGVVIGVVTLRDLGNLEVLLDKIVDGTTLR
ncbi:MAG: chloride channel protein [Ilumatobacteraceae bacterium]